MMHIDIATTNALVAARHESVANMMAASRRRSQVIVWLGVGLVWLGEKLRQDVPVTAQAGPVPDPSQCRPGMA